MEIDNDRKMFRTRDRPLPSGRMSPNQAIIAAASAGISGVGLLAFTVRFDEMAFFTKKSEWGKKNR